jgi:hypothetical protein
MFNGQAPIRTSMLLAGSTLVVLGQWSLEGLSTEQRGESV